MGTPFQAVSLCVCVCVWVWFSESKVMGNGRECKGVTFVEHVPARSMDKCVLVCT
jgi:hypothetical protein